MRDIKRLEPLYNTLLEVHKQYPDWRLGRLLSNIFRDMGYDDGFYVEDDKLLDKLNEMLISTNT